MPKNSDVIELIGSKSEFSAEWQRIEEQTNALVKDFPGVKNLDDVFLMIYAGKDPKRPVEMLANFGFPSLEIMSRVMPIIVEILVSTDKQPQEAVSNGFY